jgi:GntR family transcriptional regulator/MocR family aminotransferase
MSRESPGSISPYLPFDRRAPGSYYGQIYKGYRAAILEGRLRPGQRLPSTRALANELGISRLPVLNAFDQLLHEGFIEGRAGAGTFVSSSILDEADKPARAASHRPSRLVDGPQTPDPDTLLGPFRVSMPALDQFPLKTWARLVARRARTMSIDAMAYGDSAGHYPLRLAIADYLRTARAVSCEASDVLIVSGSQMALRLCAMALLKRGDEVCVEDPSYPGARRALTATGARLRPVPVDDEGLVVRALASGGRRRRVAYVTPSHQYPLGVSMSAPRRLELLEWARRNESWIIEDDYDSEFRYASRPLGSLQGMDTAARVIYVGTFSKVLFPSLRLGYIVVPPNLFKTFIDHRESLDIFSPTLSQLALSDFLSEGHFARHVRRMRATFLWGRAALVEAIHRPVPPLTIANADAGMHLTTWLPPAINDRDVVRKAASRGISVHALSTCYVGNTSRMGLVLGFGGADEETIDSAAKTLSEVL